MYTIGRMLKRLCIEDFMTSNGELISKGTFVIIPMEAIHKDSSIYKNPEKFDPDRFLESGLHSMAFLAFGAGQRGCIGASFGELQAKMLIIELIRLYKFSKSDKTEVPILMDPYSKLIKPKNDIILNFEKI